MATEDIQNINYIETDEVIEVYQNIIRQYGRLHKFMLKRKIDDMILTSKQYEGDIFSKAAVLLKELITPKPRIFIDGHKRVGWICTVRFFELNGYQFIDLTKLEDIDFIEKNIVSYLIKIQQKKITDIEEINVWLQSLFIKDQTKI